MDIYFRPDGYRVTWDLHGLFTVYDPKGVEVDVFRYPRATNAHAARRQARNWLAKNYPPQNRQTPELG